MQNKYVGGATESADDQISASWSEYQVNNPTGLQQIPTQRSYNMVVNEVQCT